MSPPNSSSRLTAQGEIVPVSRRSGIAVALLELGAERQRIEQAERALEDRADLVAGLQHVDRLLLHQLLQALGERGLAAADRTQQVEDLLALFEPLRRVAEEADDPLDRLLHPVEIRERRIDLDRAVHEDAAEPRILARVDHLRLADRLQHALGGAGVVRRIVGTFAEVFLERVLDLSPVVVQP